MMATRATRPTVRPTAPPVLIPELLWLFVTPPEFAELGGTVGVTVTVLTSPVTVSRKVDGVGVHVEELEDEDVDVVLGVGVVVGSDVVVAVADD